MASKKNLVKRNLPFIYTFDHEVPIVIRAMQNLTVGVFEHLEITYIFDIDLRIKYTERILRGPALKKF